MFKLLLSFDRNDVVPVVMGGRKQDYEAAAPPGSFIHVDDFDDVKDLANYLQHLMDNPKLYNQYFRWKGTGHFINTKFWCRVCAMLHSVIGSGLKARGDTRREGGMVEQRWYGDLEQWWRNNETCTKGSWKDKEFYDKQDWREMLGMY